MSIFSGFRVSVLHSKCRRMISMNVARRHFAAGDYLTRYEAGFDYELEIDTPFEKPGWKPRTTPVEFSSAVFPGSAVQFEQRLYEVVNMTREPLRIHYFLRSWDSRFPVRVQFHYTTAECAKLEQRRKQEIADSRTTLVVHLFTPLLGLIPAADQMRIERRYGISSSRLTVTSAFLVLIPSVFAIISLIVGRFGAPQLGPAILHDFYKFGPYFFCESIVRIINAGFWGEPMGSLPICLGVEAYRTIRRNLDPNFRQSRFEKMETGHRQLIKAVDEVRELKGKDYDLEIISILPKSHWNPLTGIRYNGIWYGYLDSEKFGKTDSPQYRFRLKRAPEGMVFSTFLDYAPDEVQKLFREKQRQDAGTWVATFSPLWGLLDGQDQRKLQKVYGFDCMKYTWWTILGLGLLGFFNFLASIVNLGAGISTPADIFWLIASTYLLFETYLRWAKWKQGEPSGSVLGILLQPFAGKLFV